MELPGGSAFCYHFGHFSPCVINSEVPSDNMPWCLLNSSRASHSASNSLNSSAKSTNTERHFSGEMFHSSGAIFTSAITHSHMLPKAPTLQNIQNANGLFTSEIKHWQALHLPINSNGAAISMTNILLSILYTICNEASPLVTHKRFC